MPSMEFINKLNNEQQALKNKITIKRLAVLLSIDGILNQHQHTGQKQTLFQSTIQLFYYVIVRNGLYYK